MASRPNPFHYGTPAEGDFFTGRNREVQALVSRITNHINVVLVSPRRYGKTSVLLRAEAELADNDRAIIHVNVLRCRDLGALVGKLTGQAYAMRGARWHRAKQAVPEFLHRLRITPGVTFDAGGSPSFTFGPNMTPRDADDMVADVYALLAEEAADRPAALILDEFQSIPDHGGHLPDLLKALADEHPKVSLVLAGSKRHLMDRLVTAHDAPLYNMAQRLALGPIPDAEMAAYLETRSADGGAPMTPEVAAAIVALAGPVPNDIQHLAYEAFEVAGRRIDRAAVAAGLELAVDHEAPTYVEEFSRRAPGQRQVLIELAHGGTDAPASETFVRACRLANASSVSRALTAMDTDDLVAHRDGRWVVADPFFATWLRQADL